MLYYTYRYMRVRHTDSCSPSMYERTRPLGGKASTTDVSVYTVEVCTCLYFDINVFWCVFHNNNPVVTAKAPTAATWYNRQ